MNVVLGFNSATLTCCKPQQTQTIKVFITGFGILEPWINSPLRSRLKCLNKLLNGLQGINIPGTKRIFYVFKKHKMAPYSLSGAMWKHYLHLDDLTH